MSTTQNVVHRVGDHVEVKVVIALEALLDEAVEPGDGPAVQGLHLVGGHQVVGVEPSRLPRQYRAVLRNFR